MLKWKPWQRLRTPRKFGQTALLQPAVTNMTVVGLMLMRMLGLLCMHGRQRRFGLLQNVSRVCWYVVCCGGLMCWCSGARDAVCGPPASLHTRSSRRWPSERGRQPLLVLSTAVAMIMAVGLAASQATAALSAPTAAQAAAGEVCTLPFATPPHLRQPVTTRMRLVAAAAALRRGAVLC